MAEWSIASASKAEIPERVSGVRILSPPSPARPWGSPRVSTLSRVSRTPTQLLHLIRQNRQPQMGGHTRGQGRGAGEGAANHRPRHALERHVTACRTAGAFLGTGSRRPRTPSRPAAARFSSFADATAAVRMADIELSESQVRRLAHQVGHELIAERDRKATEHRRRRLPARTAKTPQAVVVEVDGGRIRTRAADAGRGVHDAQNKEDKIACLATLSGPTFVTDPWGELPLFRPPHLSGRLWTVARAADSFPGGFRS